MTTKAFILIETAVSTSSKAYQNLINITDVVTVDRVSGPYDLIAVVSSTDLNSIGELVTSKIHKIPGIMRTVTCLGLD
jgi:DNA-binding Lrp family transcriptional regulator